MKAELIFIPSPGIGHLHSNIELAKQMIALDDRLSATVLLLHLPFEIMHETHADYPSTARLRFRHLPESDLSEFDNSDAPPGYAFYTFIAKQKHKVKEAVMEDSGDSPANPPRLAGFVVDMFCASMIDVADEFGVPAYVFYTSGAAALGLGRHFEKVRDGLGFSLTGSEAQFDIPSFSQPVPAKVLPSSLLATSAPLPHIEKMRVAKGVIVNTFEELESRALESFWSPGSPPFPPVYPVGPILSAHSGAHREEEILTWLDQQPPSSVVFLCFGSMGSFGPDQIKEIARGLELCGFRFLWSLRKPPPKGTLGSPVDYSSPPEVLPGEFLDRTAQIGRVIGWAPQVQVLEHPAVGGFVSHCGWNSVLESLYCGVPIATWPLYAEQQLNAFTLVKELKIAVEISLDYRRDFRTEGSDCSVLVSASEVAAGIECVMDQGSEVREKVKEMKEKSRKALLDGGSSIVWLRRLIDDVIKIMP